MRIWYLSIGKHTMAVAVVASKRRQSKKPKRQPQQQQRWCSRVSTVALLPKACMWICREYCNNRGAFAAPYQNENSYFSCLFCASTILFCPISHWNIYLMDLFMSIFLLSFASVRSDTLGNVGLQHAASSHLHGLMVCVNICKAIDQNLSKICAYTEHMFVICWLRLGEEAIAVKMPL